VFHLGNQAAPFSSSQHESIQIFLATRKDIFMQNFLEKEEDPQDFLNSGAIHSHRIYQEELCLHQLDFEHYYV
jgi:hypothetical protein